MTSTSLDLSLQNDLRWLSALVAAVRAGAAGISFFVTGATARDLLLWYGHKIHTGRTTKDVDIAVAVAGWDEFSAFKARLLASGVFSEERLWNEGAHLLTEPGFDYESAGAWLFGRDMATLLDRDGQLWLSALLQREAEPEGPLRLVGDMRTDPGLTLPLVQAAAKGVREVTEGEKAREKPQ